AVELFLEEKTKSRRSRTVSDYKRLLGLLSFHGQLSDITHEEAARQIGKVKAPSEHNHALVAANVFFNWCQKRHYIEKNPFRGLSTHSRVPRARVLSDHELQLIWQETEEPKIFHAMVRLLILTGQRCGEIAALQTSFFKDMVCTLPSTLTKNGREHSFPIGRI